MERAGRVPVPSKTAAATVFPGDACAAEDSFKDNTKSRSNSLDLGVHSAALVIIGDEILSGFTADENIQVTARALGSIGIPLKVVSVISDSIEEIAAEVLRASQKYDIVFTSGGIGPTHDDVTLKAVARALNQELKLNAEMLEHLRAVQIECAPSGVRLMGNNNSTGGGSSTGIDDSLLPFAMLPEHAKLRFPPAESADASSSNNGGTDSPYSFASSSYSPSPCITPPPPSLEGRVTTDATGKTTGKSTETMKKPSATESTTAAAAATGTRKTWPVLQCDNIFVLPGVPQFFATKMDLIVKYFLSRNHRPHRRKIVLDLEERALVSVLDCFVAKHERVKFGSYPFVDHPEFKTIITLEGPDRDSVEQAVAGLLNVLPANAVLRVAKGAAAGRV